MTDLLTIARECGGTDYTSVDHGRYTEFSDAALAAFAERIRTQAAREQKERDAVICNGIGGSDRWSNAHECASAIRSQPDPLRHEQVERSAGDKGDAP